MNKKLNHKHKLLISVFISIIILIICFNRIAFIKVDGTSMEPDFPDGWSGILIKGFSIKKGDYISFKEPESWKSLESEPSGGNFIKEVLAVKGDTLTFNGRVFSVNDEPMAGVPENVKCFNRTNYSHVLGQDEIFVVGKDFYKSLDSRRAFCAGVPFYIKKDAINAFGSITFP